MTYYVGDHVWLKPFDNGEEVVPRERAEIIGSATYSWGLGFTVQVEPKPEEGDYDGLREIDEEQIEGLIR